MDRRRVAFALAGLVVVGGAVVALRLGGGTQHAAATATTPSLPTSIHAFAAAGVLAPGPGDHPDLPGRLTITTGPHRLQVGWGSAVPGGHDPRDAVGYDVRWGTGGQLDHER